jgi:hypothetical protein
MHLNGFTKKHKEKNIKNQSIFFFYQETVSKLDHYMTHLLSNASLSAGIVLCYSHCRIYYYVAALIKLRLRINSAAFHYKAASLTLSPKYLMYTITDTALLYMWQGSTNTDSTNTAHSLKGLSHELNDILGDLYY